MKPPRVHLHDGLGGRIGTLKTPSSVNRAWALMQPSQASVRMGLDDPLLAELNPNLGRALVIESGQYAHPWVGGITDYNEDEASGTVQVLALSLDAILRERVLASDASYSNSAGATFRQILEGLVGANDAGIGVAHDIADGPTYATSLPESTVYSALNKLCQQTGHEWWVEYDVSPSRITATAHYRPDRGFDRYAGPEGVTLSDGGNCERLASGGRLDGIYKLTMVAGQTSTLQAYDERKRATRTSSKGFPASGASTIGTFTVHGYEIEHADLGGSPLTRRERVRIAENLRSTGAVDAAAEIELGRPKTAERVLKLRLTSEDRGLWAACDIGSVVRFRSARAFLGQGFDGPVRIVSVQPMEEAGDLVLVAQALKGKS